MMVKIVVGHSLEYRAGRVAAHIDYCGKYDLNRALYNKYGKSEDYKNGKIDTSIQNGRGESHEERHLHCDEVENFTEKLLNASAQEKASKSKAYNAGRAATIIEDACGRYELSEKLYNEFGSQSDFTEGLSSIMIQEKDDTSIDCDAIESWIDELLGRSTRIATFTSNNGVANALPKCTDQSYRHNCEGTVTYSNGNKYVGAFKDDNFHGQGIYTFADGRTKEGMWEQGKLLYAQKAPSVEKSIAEKENESLRQEIARLKKQQQAQTKKIVKKPVKKSPPAKPAGTGSGFFVSKLGHIVTNEHVVRNCGSITVGDSTTNQVGATLLEKDKRNDLALLRISSTQMASAESKSLISKLGLRVEISTPSVPLASGGLLRPDDVELGEDLLVSGYPYGDIFSNTIKVTKGIVSANKGMGDDSSQFQMDAAVQAGNSGGPIYDENGNIVGVVVQQLNKLKVAKVMGSLPENVNFGIKASTVRQFLTAAGLPTKWSNRSKRRSTKDLAKIAKNQTVMVVCNP